MYYQNHKNIYGEIEVIYLISNQYFYVIKSDFASVPGFNILERGFTGHEHILQFGIINMNARLYDPIIASFLSPDNEVTDPENPQNYNRFSYALNNPLRYTDPSGNNPLLVAWIFSTIVQAGATWQSQGFNQALVSCLVNSTISLALSNISGVFPQYASGSWESLAVHISKTMSSNLISGMLTGGKYTGQAAVLSITSSIMSWGTEAALASSSMNEASLGSSRLSTYKGPKSWHPKHIIEYFYDEIIEISNLQKDEGYEYGFGVVWNDKNQEMYATDPIRGKEKSVYYSTRELSKIIKLNQDEVLIGLFHSHPNHYDQYINQFSWGQHSPGDFGNFHDMVENKFFRLGSDIGKTFDGVVTPKEIQIIQVNNKENFLNSWENNNPQKFEDFNSFKNKPNSFFKDNNFYRQRR